MLDKLYCTNAFSAVTQQQLIACELTGKHIEMELVNKKYPPATLVTQQGTLNQANAILCYLCQGSCLIGKDDNDVSEIAQWLQHFNIELSPVLKELNNQVFGHTPSDADKFNYGLKELTKELQLLSSHLRLRTFMVGDAITLVDICFAVQLDSMMRLIVTEEWRKTIPNLVRWFTYVRSIPPFTKHLGRPILCGKNCIQVAENVKSGQETNDAKKEKKPAKGGKQEKTGQAKKKQIKESDEENVQPLDDEKGFKLDAFKRQFQNTADKETVVKKILQNFDSGWSLWKIYYEKDVTEGKVDYLTQNLAYGSLQRLEGLRKFGFGSWGVYGEPDNYEIRGVMMWKGTEITQTWKEHPSFMFHKFEKLNPTKEPDVECILAYWLGQQAEGLPRKDSKLLI